MVKDGFNNSGKGATGKPSAVWVLLQNNNNNNNNKMVVN